MEKPNALRAAESLVQFSAYQRAFYVALVLGIGMIILNVIGLPEAWWSGLRITGVILSVVGVIYFEVRLSRLRRLPQAESH